MSQYGKATSPNRVECKSVAFRSGDPITELTKLITTNNINTKSASIHFVFRCLYMTTIVAKIPIVARCSGFVVSDANLAVYRGAALATTRSSRGPYGQR